MEVDDHLQELKILIKRGPIDNKFRELLIHPDFIRFEVGNFSNPHIEIKKSLVNEYRFGVRWISGYKFTIGREYQIFIRDSAGQILKIHFKSFYGIKKIECHNLYSKILSNFWKYYFHDIANNYIQQFWNNVEFTICGVVFCNESLKIKKFGVFKEVEIEIPWDKVRTKDYQTYFVIHSADNPAKENKSFSYLDDWNTDILHSVTKTIVNNFDK